MTGLYDLHTHSLLSDGEMLPIELIRRMAVTGTPRWQSQIMPI
jgi:predicted metal-dependent phosphoesterase TrpH